MELLMPAIAGLAGSLVMMAVMKSPSYLHIPETRMVSAVGSYFTHDKKNAQVAGTAIHMAMGIIFAYGYMLLMSTAPGSVAGVTSLIVYTIMGTIHGVVVALFLEIAVVQYHPMKEYRRLQPGELGSHVFAHVAYGFTLGAVMAIAA